MKTKWLSLSLALVMGAGCATSNPRTPASRSDAANEPTLNATELRHQWLNAARQPDQETQIQQEITALTRRWTEAMQRRDSAAVEKILAEEFTGVFGAGETVTKSKALAGLKLSEVEWSVIEDVKVRPHKHFPVVTFRSTWGFKSGTATITLETFNSVQFRGCSVEEKRRGYETWLITSATHMQIHQMPPDYWTNEKIPKKNP